MGQLRPKHNRTHIYHHHLRPPRETPPPNNLVLDVQLLQQLRRALPDAELAGAVDVRGAGLGNVHQGADRLEVGVRPVEDDLLGGRWEG